MNKKASIRNYLFFILSIFIFFFNGTISAEPIVNLFSDCEKESVCTPRKWYIKDDFQTEYLKNDFSFTEEWRTVEKFPLWLNKYFLSNSELASYTLVTDFLLPKEYLETDNELGIQFGEIGEVFSIYINGNLIKSEGKVENGIVTYHRTVRGKTFHVPRKYINPMENRILIHIQGDPRFDHTGFYLGQGYNFGDSEILKSKEQNRIGLALILVYIVLGYYHFFLFIKRPKERENLLFGIYCIGIGLYLITRNNAIFEFDIDSTYIQRLELMTLYPIFSTLLLFHDYLFFRKISKKTLYYFYLSFFLSLPTIFVKMYVAEYILRFWQLSVLVYYLPISLYVFWDAIKQKIKNAFILFWFYLVTLLAACFDILDSAVLNTGIAFSQYTFFIYILGIFTVLANKFVSLHNETEELNTNLEIKVTERTKELSESLNTVQSLKRQQDGDYFLTSLLIKALITSDTITEKVNVRFKMKQKKQFEFQKKSSEIGGDLCRSDVIQLRGKSFTVFFNADAMGKSMQGAGGALVLGAVFDAILERTIITSSINNLYPEKWLKNSIIELHKVFESFDGSMMVSIVIGLIDNDSGLVYYFNAEHPLIIYYRDKKASFITEQAIYRKLGSPITGEKIEIQTFQLQKGDKFIIGSDGKDDILIDRNGKLELNYEESLFLSTVEENEGDLDRMFHYFIAKEEIQTDDLSLMTIELAPDYIPLNLLKNSSDSDQLDFYNLEPEELLRLWEEIKQDPEYNPHSLKKLALAFSKQRLYKESLEITLNYIHFEPNDLEMIYIASYLCRKNKFFKESIELGERVLIRKRNHTLNLANLAKSYLAMENIPRAEYLLNILKNYDPDVKFIKSIEQSIQNVSNLSES